MQHISSTVKLVFRQQIEKKGFLMFDAKCSGGDGDQYMKGLRVACTVGRCFATTQNLKKNILVFVVFVFVV